MIVYMIVDENTGHRWSRNRWGSATACPDLYKTANGAFRQITAGKIMIMQKYNKALNPKVHKLHLLTNSQYNLLTA